MVTRTALLGLDKGGDGEHAGIEIERRLAIDSTTAETCAEVERCRICGAPATVELFTDYWLCQPCCDGLGREAMKLSRG
jgi:hypothetical protein